MTDAALRWRRDSGTGDLAIDGADLAREGSLTTAILLSLFTDRRVSADELPAGETDRRGWWGDALSADGDRIGSKLWLLARRKQSPDVLLEAESHAAEALAWMTEDGVATAVDVSATFPDDERLEILAVATRPDGSRVEVRRVIALEAV